MTTTLITSAALDRRLAALEAARTAAPARLSPEEVEAARRYAASLDDPGDPDPRASAYWADASLHQIAADYAVMVGGGPAPWE